MAGVYEQMNLWQAPIDQTSIVIPMVDADVRFYPRAFNPEASKRLYRALDQTICWRQDHIKIFGQSHPLPRLTAWYGDPGTSYTYSGIEMQPLPWTAVLLEIKAGVEALTGVAFNCVLLNKYRTGQDGMGWHSDDEPELGTNPRIASVSFGGARRFVFKHKYRQALGTIEIEGGLTDGSLLLMQGETQHCWQHRAPKTAKAVEPRINLTFRVRSHV